MQRGIVASFLFPSTHLAVDHSIHRTFSGQVVQIALAPLHMVVV